MHTCGPARDLEMVRAFLKRARKRQYEPGRRRGYLGVRYLLLANAHLDRVMTAVVYV